MAQNYKTDQEYYDALEAAGHKLRRNEDGSVDHWGLDHGYHNGPICLICDDSWCEHCQDKIQPCEGK